MPDKVKSFLACEFEQSSGNSRRLTGLRDQDPLRGWAYISLQSLQCACQSGCRANAGIGCGRRMQQASREFIGTTLGSRRDAGPADRKVFAATTVNTGEQGYGIA